MTFNPNSCSKQVNLFPWSLSEFYSSRGGHKNNEAHALGWWKWDMGAAKYDPVPTIPLRARRLPSVHHWWHQYQAAIAAASISNWMQPANVPPSWASPCPWGSWSKISVRVFSNSLCGSKGSIMSSKGTSYRPKCHFLNFYTIPWDNRNSFHSDIQQYVIFQLEESQVGIGGVTCSQPLVLTFE